MLWSTDAIPYAPDDDRSAASVALLTFTLDALQVYLRAFQMFAMGVLVVSFEHIVVYQGTSFHLKI